MFPHFVELIHSFVAFDSIFSFRLRVGTLLVKPASRIYSNVIIYDITIDVSLPLLHTLEDI